MPNDDTLESPGEPTPRIWVSLLDLEDWDLTYKDFNSDAWERAGEEVEGIYFRAVADALGIQFKEPEKRDYGRWIDLHNTEMEEGGLYYREPEGSLDLLESYGIVVAAVPAAISLALSVAARIKRGIVIDTRVTPISITREPNLPRGSVLIVGEAGQQVTLQSPSTSQITDIIGSFGKKS